MSTENIALIVKHVTASRYMNGTPSQLLLLKLILTCILVVHCVTVAGLVTLLYDHFLTFDDEVKLIWKAKMSLPKLLFLFNRYVVPTMMVMKTNGTSYLCCTEIGLMI